MPQISGPDADASATLVVVEDANHGIPGQSLQELTCRIKVRTGADQQSFPPVS